MSLSVVGFDLYGTLLDLGSLAGPVRGYTPMAEGMVEAWRARQLQLANLATSTGRYVDFDRLTLVALHEVAPRFHLKLAPADQKFLLDAWAALQPYPDVGFALEAVARRGLAAVVLTNAVESTARNALAHANLESSFDAVLSADAVEAYKPNGNVYRLIEKRCGVQPEDVAFVSAHDWDASGARQAGLHSIWVQRERTGQGRPERTIEDLSGLGTVLDELMRA